MWVTGVQTCALPILLFAPDPAAPASGGLAGRWRDALGCWRCFVHSRFRFSRRFSCCFAFMLLFSSMLVWSFAIALGGGVSCFPAPLHEQRSWWPEFVEVGSGVVSVNKPAGVSSPLSVLPVMFCRFGCHGGRGLAVLLGGGVLGEREGDGGPGGCRWLVGVGSAGFLHGRSDPKRDELGAWRRPMQIHWPDPSRRKIGRAHV